MKDAVLTKSFNIVYFEIFGGCNAHCPYCITGKGDQNGKAVNVDDFKYTIEKLQEEKLINDRSVINLLNWGEPLLHPKFIEIIEYLNKSKIKFALSSNLSKLPSELKKEHFEYLTSFMISMPGFSQSSYDKIHQLDFNTILNHINKLHELIPSKKLVISYHIYQFNIVEYRESKQYFNNLGIKIVAIFAYFNNYNQSIQYLNNTLPYDEYKNISQELILYYVEEMLANVPKEYHCSQFDRLTIDENCNIITCCAVPKNSESYIVCNIRDFSHEKFATKLTKPICTECYDSGMVYWPDYAYKESTKFIENLFGNSK